ncbi:EF-P 5-aminopentanol modification-associated protein YfmF [Bacillus sp. FJAT-44742]|uniref:EF-P 5-aminopentanol modification-associated protein YfmF n=1 Tax=Bacillus sp. FJAT-44742 TaxID=2014005 RepID=UPI000C23C5F9|nr:pitrilysin family protein [Bacillus sp. FJAT-44742]
MIQEETYSVKGLHVHVVPTDKFKTNTVVLQVKAPLKKETVTQRSLLANVLKSATKNHPTRKDIRLYLDELYGASFGIDVTKKGEAHLISFRIEVANEKYLQDPSPLLTKSLEFLRDVLFDPFMENGGFSESIITEEKRTLKQRLESIFDDKMRYANVRLIEEMCKDEPYGIHPYGSEEEIEKIGKDDLKETYDSMINEDDFDLYVVGDVKENELKKDIQELFRLPEREGSLEASSAAITKPEDVREISEEQDVQQGKLNIGYRTSIIFKDENYPAMQVMNGLFGGFPHSKLFINVREKESLAYYAASRYESSKGLLLVMSGVDQKNYDKALTIIKEQMKAMKDGDFSDKEIEQTKQMLKNQLLEMADVPRGLIEMFYQGVVSGKKRSLDDWLEAIEKVTKEDVIECAKTVEMDTIYFLRGKEAK